MDENENYKPLSPAYPGFRPKTLADWVVIAGGSFLCWAVLGHPEWFSFLDSFQIK